MEIKPKQITWDKIPKDWLVQPKYDGECCKLIINNGTVVFQRFAKDGKTHGRVKTEFYPEIIEYVKGLIDYKEKYGIDENKYPYKPLPNMVLVGEVCVLLDRYRASFPHIQLRMNTVDKDKQKKAMKDKLATFMAFDIEEFEGKNLDNMNYKYRYDILSKEIDTYFLDGTYSLGHNYGSLVAVNNLDPIDRIPSSIGLDWEMFVKKHEMEGIVVKNPNHPNEWVKLKNFDEDNFTIVGTELKAEGKARGWFISKLNLEDTDGTHVDKGMRFDCKYINYPQTEQAKIDVIGKTAIVKYMKMRGRDGKYIRPRHPSLVEILEYDKVKDK